MKLVKYFFFTLIFITVTAAAKPYINGTFQDDIGQYDTPAIKASVIEASKICIAMFKGDFIVTHWLYAPKRDEVYLTGKTRSWFFPKNVDCSYRPSNQSATGSKYANGPNMLGEYEHFTTGPSN